MRNVEQISFGVMGRLQSILMEIYQNVGNYVPTLVWKKQAQELKQWKMYGIPFDQLPEAQKQKKNYTKLAEQLEVGHYISLLPKENSHTKTPDQVCGRAKYVQSLIKKRGGKAHFRIVRDKNNKFLEYQVYRVK